MKETGLETDLRAFHELRFVKRVICLICFLEGKGIGDKAQVM